MLDRRRPLAAGAGADAAPSSAPWASRREPIDTSEGEEHHAKIRHPLMPLPALAALVAPLRRPCASPTHTGARGAECVAADRPPAPFNPQMGALMSMLIQPRHAKLGLAGTSRRTGRSPAMRSRSSSRASRVIARGGPALEGAAGPGPDRRRAEPADLRGARFRHQGRRAAAVREAYDKLTPGCNNCHPRRSRFIVSSPERRLPNQESAPDANSIPEPGSLFADQDARGLNSIVDLQPDLPDHLAVLLVVAAGSWREFLERRDVRLAGARGDQPFAMSGCASTAFTSCAAGR